MTTASITVPATTDGSVFEATANASDGVKALRVGAGETFTVNQNIPYEVTVTFLAGTTSQLVASRDGAAQPILTTLTPSMLTVDGNIIFTADNQFMETL